MTDSITVALEKVHSGVGQGSVLEQIDKRYRKQQRLTLFEMLEKVDSKAVENFPVFLYKHIAQNGKKQPALLRDYFICLIPVIIERDDGTTRCGGAYGHRF